jgi:hypothetical protein
MQFPMQRTVCEKCGRVTITHMLADVQLRTWSLDDGSPLYIMLCPEHRAELVRLFSDFLQGVSTDA